MVMFMNVYPCSHSFFAFAFLRLMFVVLEFYIRICNSSVVCNVLLSRDFKRVCNVSIFGNLGHSRFPFVDFSKKWSWLSEVMNLKLGLWVHDDV